MKCPYCGKDAKLVNGSVIYPTMKILHSQMFWQCAACDAYVGCHKSGCGHGDGTKPLGALANKKLRDMRMMVHRRLDSIWSTKKERSEIYSWLAEKLNLSLDECHVALFDEATCKLAIDILDNGD